ncbi:laccase [Serinicoccus chungangensis]|uniref:Laccase n=1 Tax=Serinicoccus chungangensis TaxID=767452 RepID=A0A0W8I5L7_9MICO|nr:polyphenol oxidase family protein [Serinicoccus chungangensis]KUG53562.1 laccase [Serinicoccus chungangensis]
MFTWRERLDPTGDGYGVEWAVTDRHGGASQDAYASFNLGGHVGDLPEAVETNRHRLAHELGLRGADLRLMDQQHGCSVALTPSTGVAVGAGASRPPATDRGGETPAPAADALVSDRTDEALVVLVADCVPLLLVDRTEGLAAAVHAGRPGLLAGVVPAALRVLGELGARRLEAVVGPSVCPRCYEVPRELRDEAAALTPSAAAVSWTGTPAIDVASGVVQQLADSDLEVSLRWLPGCTRERSDLYSYRRDGATGRFAGVVRLLPPEQVA